MPAQLRELNPGAKALIVTGYGAHDIYERSKELQGETVLVKPIDVDAVLRILETLDA